MAAAESMGVDGKDSNEESDNHNGKDGNESVENTDGHDDGEPAEDADGTESNADPDTEETYVPPGYLPAGFIFFMTRGGSQIASIAWMFSSSITIFTHEDRAKTIT